MDQLKTAFRALNADDNNSPGTRRAQMTEGKTGTEVRTLTLGLAKVFTLLWWFPAFGKLAQPTVLPLSNHPRPGTPTPGSLFCPIRRAASYPGSLPSSDEWQGLTRCR
jgi:hypothetical protein